MLMYCNCIVSVRPLYCGCVRAQVLAAVAKDLGKAGKQTAVDIGEYNNIFSTRPKVPRTPNGLQ